MLSYCNLIYDHFVCKSDCSIGDALKVTVISKYGPTKKTITIKHQLYWLDFSVIWLHVHNLRTNNSVFNEICEHVNKLSFDPQAWLVKYQDQPTSARPTSPTTRPNTAHAPQPPQPPPHHQTNLSILLQFQYKDCTK